jgi:hypothetical protein
MAGTENQGNIFTVVRMGIFVAYIIQTENTSHDKTNFLKQCGKDYFKSAINIGTV